MGDYDYLAVAAKRFLITVVAGSIVVTSALCVGAYFTLKYFGVI